MQNPYFHNRKLQNENNDKKKSAQTSKIDTKNIVDINILLNRVKTEEKNQTKRNIIFFSIVTTALSLFGTFIVVVN